MAIYKHVALDRKEITLRVLFGLATILIAFVLVHFMTSSTDLASVGALMFEFEAKKILIVLLYGIFALWVTAHLDVIGDQLQGGRKGRVAALKIGLIGRAFTHCGAWTRFLRWRIWRSLQLRSKPSNMRRMLRASRAAYVFGLVVSFFLINLIFPRFVMGVTGFDEGFVRLIFGVLIGGTLMISNQNDLRRLRIKCTALGVVMLGNLVAAFAFYVLISERVDISFGALCVAMIMAQGVAWAMRVPFMLGVLEVALLSVCAPEDRGELLAACGLFHIFFQSPGLITAFWISFSLKSNPRASASGVGLEA